MKLGRNQQWLSSGTMIFSFARAPFLAWPGTPISKKHAGHSLKDGPESWIWIFSSPDTACATSVLQADRRNLNSGFRQQRTLSWGFKVRDCLGERGEDWREVQSTATLLQTLLTHTIHLWSCPVSCKGWGSFSDLSRFQDPWLANKKKRIFLWEEWLLHSEECGE